MKKQLLFLSILFCMPVMLAHADEKPQAATADIYGTDSSSDLYGQVVFIETEGGLKVTANIENAPAGKHGFHIHEFGSCGEAGKEAGGHFNPEHVDHGFLPENGIEHAHAGDLGNIEIDADGMGHLELTLPNVTIQNPNSAFNIAGRAVIMHAGEDDFGQPTGNAGGRIGCGPIIVRNIDDIETEE